MNGQAFKSLRLHDAILVGNECIDANYSRKNESPLEVVAIEFLLEVSKKCGFIERPPKKNQISCLKDDCDDDYGNVCCNFDDTTVINSADFSISDGRNDDVSDISFDKNSKIEFLPITVFLKFSNVRTYNADNCLIKEISIRNFEHLFKLEVLSLAFNQIKIIQHDTFEGLNKLESISLSKYLNNS